MREIVRIFEITREWIEILKNFCWEDFKLGKVDIGRKNPKVESRTLGVVMAAQKFFSGKIW